ncbi:MAG: Carbohydrate-binding family [Actinomycetia bacterium]|nr:Carbohydrate-binding family [Actinomycetes bacterium]
MTDFHTHWIPSGLPGLAARSGNSRWPVFDQPTGRLMISGEAVRAVPASGWDIRVLLDAMDAAGIARHVLSPVPPLLCDWTHPKPGTEWATAINDWLAEPVRPFYTDSVVYRPPNLRYVADTLGAGHVCFGTDYPLPVHADPADSIVDSLDRAEAAWVRERPAQPPVSHPGTPAPGAPAPGTPAPGAAAGGSENWGGVPGASFASENIPQLQAAGLKYVVSTGGEAGTFTCDSTADMDTFIARYASPDLVGIDFDIEGGQTESDIQDLVNAVAGAQSQYPNLQFSFTLATLAASDGSYGGVNSLGNEVVDAVLGSSLKNYVINLMTMDYGSASASVCVVVSGSCEMAQSAIQAVENLEHTYGISASKIAVTPMIGMNDTTSETFTLADVDTLTSYAASNGLAGLHFWSLDRDTPCTDDYASPTCNSISSTTPLEYPNRFLSDLGI